MFCLSNFYCTFIELKDVDGDFTDVAMTSENECWVVGLHRHEYKKWKRFSSIAKFGLWKLETSLYRTTQSIFRYLEPLKA